jgi:hypothetical protein
VFLKQQSQATRSVWTTTRKFTDTAVEAVWPLGTTFMAWNIAAMYFNYVCSAVHNTLKSEAGQQTGASLKVLV